MQIEQTRQRRQPLVPLRVVLHRTRPQRVEVGVDVDLVGVLAPTRDGVHEVSGGRGDVPGSREAGEGQLRDDGGGAVLEELDGEDGAVADAVEQVGLGRGAEAFFLNVFVCVFVRVFIKERERRESEHFPSLNTRKQRGQGEKKEKGKKIPLVPAHGTMPEMSGV